MEYGYKRHVTNTLLWAVVITAVGSVIFQYTRLGAGVFLVIGIITLAADRYVENKHLKEGRKR